MTKEQLPPWASEANELATRLGVSPSTGLSSSEAKERCARFGPNQLRITKPRPILNIFVDQLRSIVVFLLIVATGLSFAFGDVVEGSAIALVVLINTAIGFTTELRAVRSMEALRRLGRVETRLRRDGQILMLPADDLVPGDIVLVEAGDVVTADMRLLDASNLQADESALTGESVPVSKKTGIVDTNAHIGERHNMLFKGTSVTRGDAELVVTGTGQNTELGTISDLVQSAKPTESPIERRLNALGRKLVWVTLMLALAIALIGLAAGRDALLAIEVAIALAVAAIPEGLPIVATIALARGMWRMARRNALVSKLSAVETLGATNIILTDKTGTLTENRMTLSDLELPVSGHIDLHATDPVSLQSARTESEVFSEKDSDEIQSLLRAIVLCNAASFSRGAAAVDAVGDPTETALLVAAASFDLYHDELLAEFPELKRESFTSESQMMATYNKVDSAIRISVKGAPEAIIGCCDSVYSVSGCVPLSVELITQWQRRTNDLADRGLRTLAVATKQVASIEEPPYQNLTLLGVLGLLDPARLGVREALDECRSAGIRVVMVTGDHLATATTIANTLGMLQENDASTQCIDAREFPNFKAESASATVLHSRVVARATPKQKLDLIALHQDQGRIVAMTGDGVNDAPALKQADIGVAMGVRGTQVAKDAAAMVLQDDEFATIVVAISHGRTIYSNIRKFVTYLLSCNISEIMVVSLATIASAPLPLLPLQILFLNLVTDVFPALALGVGEGSVEQMREPPRQADEPIVTRSDWLAIAIFGLLISASVLASMYIGIIGFGLIDNAASTVSFYTLALAQIWHVLNMRANQRAWLRNEIVRNPWIWLAIAICLLLLLMTFYVPGVQTALRLEPLSAQAWLLIVIMSLIPVLLGPFARNIARFIDGRGFPSRQGDGTRTSST